jgi:hypothetical protein
VALEPTPEVFGTRERVAYGAPEFHLTVRADVGDGRREVTITQGVSGRAGYKVHQAKATVVMSAHGLAEIFTALVEDYERQAYARKLKGVRRA